MFCAFVLWNVHNDFTCYSFFNWCSKYAWFKFHDMANAMLDDKPQLSIPYLFVGIEFANQFLSVYIVRNGYRKTRFF